ncbi:SET domain-containing protein [Durotheca rogersii]|uniref:SET domain-containing protein n=1 Tax=Durotheca rogersii TaxID=419775 RepID=UPI00221FA2E2|nr:SET domain-containing protein [Durotheca rogersii]KAI5867703.1 SET domain-containing protein [Durotheca rogersii]
MQSLASVSPTRALSSEASVGAATDTFSHTASLSSTPPTTIADSISLTSDTSKPENGAAIDSAGGPAEPADVDASTDVADSIVASAEPLNFLPPSESPLPPALDTPSIGRSRRQRLSAPIYNLAKLAGTAVHGKRRAKGDDVSNRKRRNTVATQTVTANAIDEYEIPDDDEEEAQRAAARKKRQLTRDRNPSKPNPATPGEPSAPRRISTRSSGVEAETLALKLSTLGKRGRKTFDKGVSKMSRELRRLQDTDEFAGIDKKPVVYTTWANGKYVSPDEPEPPRKKQKVSAETPEAPTPEPEPVVEEEPAARKRRAKKYLDRGLYAGQDTPSDVFKGLTSSEKKRLAQLPELMPTSTRPNKVLPLPIYNGMRMLIQGRDFKLPFDVCNPLPPGQPKPDEWRKMTKNRFVGDAGAYWKKTPHFKDYQSKCVCTPEDGCGESCQNRIMLYECDDTNCNVGPHLCQNRAFARLQERIKEGGKYRVGVEVIKTKDRGYGIRSNRCFEANQIIMEYTGEIITEEECDRRMTEKYKNNQCYYLMSFDQNMIIDATTGSIARFVNHSCSPNCRMIKWIVSGQPRMALFAGDRPITTGEELTYDYNFDPFSAKNVQKCLCGSDNCRGVLGPKPKEVKGSKAVKAPKEKLTDAVKRGVNAGKRKLKEAFGDKDGENAAKKRRIKTASGVKGASVTNALSNIGAKAARGAAQAIKRTVSTISVSTKAATHGSRSSPARNVEAVRKTKTVVQTYSKAKMQTKLSFPPRSTPRASRNSSLTIVAAGPDDTTPDDAKPSLTIGEAPTLSYNDGPDENLPGSASSGKDVDLSRPVSKIRLVRPSALGA